MKKLVKIALILMICILYKTALSQTYWVDFDNLTDGVPQPKVKLNSDSIITIDFFGVNRYQKEKDSTIYDILKLPGSNTPCSDEALPQPNISIRAKAWKYRTL